MKKQLEIALIKANSPIFRGCEFYWLFSRSQLELLLKEVEIFSSPPFASTVKYQETMLPVINLEQHYGLAEKDQSGSSKYLVIRSADEKKELTKLIVPTKQTLKIQKLESEWKPLQSPVLPKHSEHVLGMYFLAADKLAVVPDFIAMSRSLRWR